MKALVVVDVDYADLWHPEAMQRYTEKQKVAEAITGVLREVRLSSGLIVFITSESPPVHGKVQTEWQRHCFGCDGRRTLPEFLEHGHEPFEPIFWKYSGNAFEENSTLAEYLRGHEVQEVVLAGCSTFACILDTARGALRERFDVTLLEECTFPPFEDVQRRTQWAEKLRAEFSHSSLSVKIE